MKLVKGGYLIDEDINKDVSDLYYKLLRLNIDVDKNVTLRDLFELLNKDLDICGIFFGEYFTEAIKDGLNPGVNPPKPKLEFDYLELSWNIELYKTDKSLGNDLGCPDFYGLKKANKKEYYSLSLVPVHQIVDLPLILNEQIRIIKLNKKSYSEEFYSGGTFSLWQICLAVSEELTFHGTSKDKEELLQELQNRVAEISKN